LPDFLRRESESTSRKFSAIGRPGIATDVSAETLNLDLTMDPMREPLDGVRRLIARFGAANYAV
jgi:hypothetical protein